MQAASAPRECAADHVSGFRSLSAELAYLTTQRCSSGTPIEGKFQGTLPCGSLRIEMSVGEASSPLCSTMESFL